MRHPRTGRILSIMASACLLLVLGCGLSGLAVQQRVITLADINAQLGPLIIVTRGPSTFICPRQNNPTANLCDRLSAAPRPAAYRVWVFWYEPRRGSGSTRTLANWTFSVRR
jgi:hypothetical protein